MNHSRLSQLFNRHCRQWHFWLRDLRSGEVLELGTRRHYPIGSCFKLAVLIAFFEQLEDPALLDQAVTIPPERFRIGAGVINLLDSTVSLTWRQMIHLMLAASEGTCTDWLIDRLGLPAVNQVLQRYAPDSHLAVDNGEMVARFRQIPGALDCKTREFSDTELSTFIEATNALGATHAEDLANLALAAWRYPGAGVGGGGADYQRCLQVSRYPYPRTKMFVEPALQLFTKTGSLGRTFFMQECGVMMEPESRRERAHFGYCSVGWRLPSGMVETAGGLIGIEIARMLGLNPALNADYTPQGAALLMPTTDLGGGEMITDGVWP